MRLGSLVGKMFQDSFNKLLRQKTIPVSTAFKLRGVAKAVREHCSKYEDLSSQYLEDYGERDESGNLKSHNMGQGQTGIILDKTLVKEYNKKMKSLHSPVLNG